MAFLILEWGLIMAVTLVSTTMLMIVSTFFAIFPEAQTFYGESRSNIVLLATSFNIFYVIISPMMFNIFNKNYYIFVVVSTIITGFGSVGRYFAGQDYQLALVMTILIAVAHIPIITAPYGLLKLFPERHRGYAASIPLFLPTLGINFCILYGMTYITNGETQHLTTAQQNEEIHHLNKIIAIVGVFATIATVILLSLLKNKINAEADQRNSSSKGQQEKISFVEKAKNFVSTHKTTITCLICWGSIVGVNWTYGSLFGIIFVGENLTEKEIALIGLAANVSTAFFSNLGTWIHNKFEVSTVKVILYLNVIGLIGAIVIECSKYYDGLQNIYILIFFIILLRAGYSSFVSLAFIEMQKSKISSVIISGIFFWIANVGNLLTMEVVDLTNNDISMLLLTLSVAVCIVLVSLTYDELEAKDQKPIQSFQFNTLQESQAEDLK